MRRLAPHLMGQANMGMANDKRETSSNPNPKIMSMATDISSYGKGARSKTQCLKPKQEVIEVVVLDDEDSSPDEAAHIPPNNCSTPIPQMSPEASVPNPVLAKLTNLDVSVSRSDRNPRQLKLPSGFNKLPPGITVLPSSESSYSDQRNMSSSERVLKAQSGRENGNTSPKKKVELNLSES